MGKEGQRPELIFVRGLREVRFDERNLIVGLVGLVKLDKELGKLFHKKAFCLTNRGHQLNV